MWGGVGWNLISEITTEEETNTIEITQDLNNNKFKCNEIIFFLRSVGTSTNNDISNTNATMRFSNIDTGFFLQGIGFKSGVTRTICVEANAKPLYWNGFVHNSTSNSNGGQLNAGNPFGGYSFDDPIESINAIKIQLQACYFGAGTKLRVYGR